MTFCQSFPYFLSQHLIIFLLVILHFPTPVCSYQVLSILILINIPNPGHLPQSSRSSSLPLAAWLSLRASLYR